MANNYKLHTTHRDRNRIGTLQIQTAHGESLRFIHTGCGTIRCRAARQRIHTRCIAPQRNATRRVRCERTFNLSVPIDKYELLSRGGDCWRSSCCSSSEDIVALIRQIATDLRLTPTVSQITSRCPTNGLTFKFALH